MTNATLRGKPDAGNLHVRFDEGEVASAKPRRGSLLYKKMIVVALVSIMSACLFADALPDGGPYKETVDGIEWTFMVKDGEAEVGSGDVEAPAISLQTRGVVTIPSALGERTVTSIGAGAFSGCVGLLGAAIPSGVSEIGWYAFYGCHGLTSIDIPDGVEYIDDNAFGECSGLLTVSIPSSVLAIGQCVFEHCGGLTNAVISEGVPCLGHAMFASCYRLRDVTLPSSVESLATSAFYNCDGIVSIAFSDGVKTIGDAAFGDCDGLVDVEIPNGVTNIEAGAFGGCKNLKSVVIPIGVVSIGESAFSYCDSLETISFPEGVMDLGSGICMDCRSLREVVIPSTVQRIRDSAFCGCESLDAVDVAEGVFDIGYRAFGGCRRLTRIVLPESMVHIGEEAFYACNGMKEVTIPSGVVSIERNAFGYCESLSKVYVDQGDIERVRNLYQWPLGIDFIEGRPEIIAEPDPEPTPDPQPDEEEIVVVTNRVYTYGTAFQIGSSYSEPTNIYSPVEASGIITNDNAIYRYDYRVEWLSISEYVVRESWQDFKSAEYVFVGVCSNQAQMIIFPVRYDEYGFGEIFGDLKVPDVLVGSNRRCEVQWGGHEMSFEDITSIDLPEGYRLPSCESAYSGIDAGFWSLSELTIRCKPLSSSFYGDNIRSYLEYVEEINVPADYLDGWKSYLATYGYCGKVKAIVPARERRESKKNDFDGSVKHIFNGQVFDDAGMMAGIVQITAAKATKQGKVSVGGFVLLEDGKRYTVKSKSVMIVDGRLVVETTAGNLGSMELKIDGDGVVGTVGAMTFKSGAMDEGTGVIKGTLTMSYFDAKTGSLKTKSITVGGVSAGGEAMGTLTEKNKPKREFAAEFE